MIIQKPHGAVRFLLGLLSIILCIALFLTATVTMLLANLKIMTNQDNIKTFISQVLFPTTQKSSPVYRFQAVGVGGLRLEDPTVPNIGDLTGDLSDITGGDLSGILSGGLSEDLLNGLLGGDSEGASNDMVTELLYGYLEQEFGEEVPITKEEMGGILEDSTIPEFVSEKLSTVVSDIITGEDSGATITKDEVLKLVEENKELIEKVTGTEVKTEVIEQIAEKVEEVKIIETVKETVEVQLGIKPAPDSLTKPDGSGSSNSSTNAALTQNVLAGILSGSVGFADLLNGGTATWLALFREVTADNVLYVMLGIFLGLFLLLFAVNYWKPQAALRKAGIILILVSLPSAALTVATLAVPSLFANVLLQMIPVVMSMTMMVSFGVFGTGLVMLILGIRWGSLRAKKLRAMTAASGVAAVVEVPVEAPVAEAMEALAEEISAEEAEEPEEIPAEIPEM